MKNLLYFILCVAPSIVCGQQQFNLDELNQPGEFGPIVRGDFEEFEIPIYFKNTKDSLDNSLFHLQNGLRSSKYVNGNEWLAIKDTVDVVAVDIVFSKYPIRRRTGYEMNYPLLCNRLINLFAIDRTLNSVNYQWNIVLQTECYSDPQVDTLYHGVVIHYKYPKVPDSLKQTNEVPVKILEQNLPETRQELINQYISSQLIPDSLKTEMDGKTPEEQEDLIANYYELQINLEDGSQEITEEYIGERKNELNEFKKTAGRVTYPVAVIDSVLYRNPQWDNILVVGDWTGSMYPYGAQILQWHLDNFKESKIKYFTLFNDGDRKDVKKIGRTEGIYHEDARNIQNLLYLYHFVRAKGNGGDTPENDVEALLKGMENFDGQYSSVILIADNTSCVRDMSLLKNVDVPIHIILCGYNKKDGVNPQYIEMAFRTGGSIHTMEEDIVDASYVTRNGKIAKMKNSDTKIGKSTCSRWQNYLFNSSIIYTDIKEVPFNKDKVINIDLSNQNLRRHYVRINRLNKLENLNLSENRLKRIAGSLRRCKHLRAFDVSNNQLKKVPNGLCQLRFIQILNLSHNKIKDIPTCIMQYVYLLRLDLSWNQIAVLPGIGGLRKLEYLDLSHNQIKGPLYGIKNLKSLKYLDLSHNQMVVISKNIFSLRNLEHLDLSYNNLTEIPMKVVGLRNLKYLNLKGNSISKEIIYQIKSTADIEEFVY